MTETLSVRLCALLLAVTPFTCLACDDGTGAGGEGGSGGEGAGNTGGSGGEGAGNTGGSGGSVTTPGIDPDGFVPAGLVTDITTEPCTLSGGTQTTCYRIQVKGAPSDHEVGPFCPRTITDGADKAGFWPEDGTAHELTGAFVANLATFYDDPEWQLFDEATGEVFVTDTQAACQGAAKPNVEPQYQNHCVECSLDYVNGGIGATYLLPVQPVPLASPGNIAGMGGVGVALNGVTFDPPAPVGAILAAHTIAAFDDCGGHVNLASGYHYHAATGCGTSIAQEDGHAALLGYAMDGYGLHAMTDEDGSEPADLDECRGHTDATRGYHYHVAGAGENAFIGCFHGEQGSRSK